MLLCRALELKLKSHHLETMRPPHVKKKFGHNLSEAYRALPSGLQILSPPELQLLEQANVVYIDDKGFDYVSPTDMITGHSRFPDLQGLIELARKLLAQ